MGHAWSKAWVNCLLVMCLLAIPAAAGPVVTVFPKEVYIEFPQFYQVRVAAHSTNPADRSLVWESSKPSVVKEVNGKLIAVATGNAVITARGARSGAVGRMKVTVAPPGTHPQPASWFKDGPYLLKMYLRGDAMEPHPLAVYEWALMKSAERGRIESVREPLEMGLSPNIRNEHGRTPLDAAIKNRHWDVVRLLLKHGATPTRRLWTLVVGAVLFCLMFAPFPVHWWRHFRFQYAKCGGQDDWTYFEFERRTRAIHRFVRTAPNVAPVRQKKPQGLVIDQVPHTAPSTLREFRRRWGPCLTADRLLSVQVRVAVLTMLVTYVNLFLVTDRKDSLLVSSASVIGVLGLVELGTMIGVLVLGRGIARRVVALGVGLVTMLIAAAVVVLAMFMTGFQM
ncbi:MAG: hypothetical protein GY851_08010 [bacterium]|nr:hypothetical protein [bacterium]